MQSISILRSYKVGLQSSIIVIEMSSFANGICFIHRLKSLLNFVSNPVKTRILDDTLPLQSTTNQIQRNNFIFMISFFFPFFCVSFQVSHYFTFHTVKHNDDGICSSYIHRALIILTDHASPPHFASISFSLFVDE